MKISALIFCGGLLCWLAACITPKAETEVVLHSARMTVAVGDRLPLSLYIRSSFEEEVRITWQYSAGQILTTPVAGEVDFIAPDDPQEVRIQAIADIGDQRVVREVLISVQTLAMQKRTADVRVTVDTTTLSDVWVDAAHPEEMFHPPLRIKGTFRMNPDTGNANSGGNWTEYLMYDDGTHGDAIPGDGIWSLLMRFEKTTEKVYFAFDEASPYRVQWESGLAWRMKVAWIELDDFPDDLSNPAFVPDSDKTVAWTAEMATKGKIYETTD